MGIVPNEVISDVDTAIVAVIKEIGDLTGEFKAATEEEQKTEIINKITEKEKDLRALRQKKGKFKAVIDQPTKLW